MKGWTKVFVLGIAKIPFKVAALFAYPFIDKKNHPIFGVRDAIDLGYYNIAIRNACHNMYSRPKPEFIFTKTNTDDATLEQRYGFQWRYRESVDGEYVSFRVTWGKPNVSRGKNEFYIGWTMNEEPEMRLTFFQLRPAWFILIPLLPLFLLWL